METAPAADLPDVFENTSHLVSEISAAVTGARCALVAMEEARRERSLAEMNAAYIELERFNGQSRLLSESLGRVIKFHVNRRKAQS